MIRLIRIIALALIIALAGNTLLQAQTKMQVTDLFASEKVKLDSLTEYSEVYITFLINRPDQAARVDFKIGKEVDSGDVFSGTATIEMRGNNFYAVFDGKSIQLYGDKITIRWVGDKAKYKDAKYVTLRVQANDGTLSDRAFCFVRFF